MPIALSLGCLFLFYIAFVKGTRTDWRESLMLAAVAWGTLVTFLTEFLSTFKLLEFWPMMGAWGIACIGLLIFLWIRRAYEPQLDEVVTREFTWFERLLLIYLLVVFVYTGVLAWFCPPNTWDSMTYHMSRVLHWMQNKNVDFYSTAILRQLHSNPWAEYAILNFQILSGSDRFANFVQWFSMTGSVVGCASLAKELGAARKGQILAAVACASLPMGILQSTSTQTDYVVGFWLVCFVYFLIRFITTGNTRYSLWLGISLGLALLTKGTAYIFAFPFVIWVIFTSIQRGKRKILWVGAGLLLACAMNTAHYSRNYELYGSPLGPGNEGGDFIYTNQTNSPSAIASNILRNIGLHMAVYPPFDNLIEKTIYGLHEHLGISADDSRTTWPGTKFHVQGTSHNEDDAGNLAHLILVAGLLLWYFFQRRHESRITRYVLSIVTAFVLFSAYLKWQPWHSRLHLPLFVLWAPFMGLMLARLRRYHIGSAASIGLMLASLSSFFLSTTKPIFSGNSIFISERNTQYFIKRPTLETPYHDAVQKVAGMKCTNIGLLIYGDDWEYPIWILSEKKFGSVVRLEHVNVTNASKRKMQSNDPGNEFIPCAIFSLDPNSAPEITVVGRPYRREWSSSPVTIYRRNH